jgi:hypothetical protein
LSETIRRGGRDADRAGSTVDAIALTAMTVNATATAAPRHLRFHMALPP